MQVADNMYTADTYTCSDHIGNTVCKNMFTILHTRPSGSLVCWLQQQQQQQHKQGATHPGCLHLGFQLALQCI